MLAQTEMSVVFVLGEKISQGTCLCNGRKNKLRFRLCWSILESATVTKQLEETPLVERGKPLERATQTMVGALLGRK